MNGLKEELRNGGHLVGTMINVIDTLDIVKIFKAAGFDFVIIDNEHGAIDNSKVAAMISLGNEMDLGVFVRISEPNREAILHYMEMGADGLMLPNCNSVEDAQALVKHAKYPPIGNRGTSMMRGHNRYIKVSSPVDYMQEQNERTILIVQVESPDAVTNIEEILSVDGIDVAFVGPNDLSSSLGIMGQYENPVYQSAVKKVIDAAAAKGKYSGIQGMTPDSVNGWICKGMQMNLYSNEVTMLLAVSGDVKEIKKLK